MYFHVFFKANCPQCPTAKVLAEKLESEGASVTYEDLDTATGLAAALKYNVRSVPTILLVNENKEQERWVYPELPTTKEAMARLS